MFNRKEKNKKEEGIKRSYNNNQRMIEDKISKKSVLFYIEKTNYLKKINFIICLFTMTTCILASYVLFERQADSKLYLTGVDGRIVEYKNDKESYEEIRKISSANAVKKKGENNAK